MAGCIPGVPVAERVWSWEIWPGSRESHLRWSRPVPLSAGGVSGMTQECVVSGEG